MERIESVTDSVRKGLKRKSFVECMERRRNYIFNGKHTRNMRICDSNSVENRIPY